MKAYARYVGTKVCLTDEDGRFVFVEATEMTNDELIVCNGGGGWITLDPIMRLLNWV